MTRLDPPPPVHVLPDHHAASRHGLRLIRCTPQQARDGSVLAAIRAALAVSETDRGAP